MDIKTIGVVGAGQMGNGIAQVAAFSGFQVVMSDIADSFVQKGLATISKNLERMVEKGKIPAQKKEEIMGRIKGTTELPDMADGRFCGRGRHGERILEARDLQRSRSDLPQRGHPFEQYLLHFHHEDRLSHATALPGDRDALYEPGSGDAAGGDHPRASNLP